MAETSGEHKLEYAQGNFKDVHIQVLAKSIEKRIEYIIKGQSGQHPCAPEQIGPVNISGTNMAGGCIPIKEEKEDE